MRIHPQLAKVLLASYQPCPAFTAACRTMKWAPKIGHVPRGFCGAAGRTEEVELVLVGAEPGDPHDREAYPDNPIAQLEAAYDYTYESFKNGTDKYHRNMRIILDLCLADMEFDSQMRRVWITDSVKCSAEKELKSVPASVESECGGRYLCQELEMFPNALIVALGGKARRRLSRLSRLKGCRVDFLHAYAAAPPGGNMRAARPSWLRVADALQARRSSRNPTP